MQMETKEILQKKAVAQSMHSMSFRRCQFKQSFMNLHIEPELIAHFCNIKLSKRNQ